MLGIDPGLRLTGYGCVEGDPFRPAIAEAGVVRLQTTRAGARASVSERLLELDRDVRALLGRIGPDVVAVEGLFTHRQLPETAIKMAHARGVILLAIGSAGLPLVELKPAEVKKSMTGSGRATKQQMQAAVQGFFGLADPPSPPDVADALSIAVCALRRSATGVAGREISV